MNQIIQELKTERNRTQQQLEKLDLAIRALSSVGHLGGVTIRRKPHFSAAAKARIAAAQRARWAKWKAAKKG